ncbi:MAG: hypothetical protein K0S56_1969 [Microvirga sp.]|jgi:hypothetical protein|nr:hypothetical protein [Microvirga sp.]
MYKTFTEMIDERLESIDLAVTWIAHGATEADLCDLRILLVDATGLLKRDPGVEAAVDDLYAAARAMVKDRPLGLQPIFRKQRLLKEANLRLRKQLHAAARRVGAREHFELPGLAAIYAAQMALRTSIQVVEVPATAA